MKPSFFSLIITIFLAGCTSLAPTIEPSSTASATSIPLQTATPKPTFTLAPTILPSPTLGPGAFVFDIAPGVPATDKAEIKLGIDLARAFIRDFLGGDISPDFKQFTIKIVADGKGNEGSCCTALAESGPRPFFDVKHSNWNIGSSDYWSNTDHHINAGAHEYTHAWQSSLGCLRIHYQPLGDWLDEGLAEYVSINTLKHNGYVTENDYKKLVSVALLDTKFENLASYERNSPRWPGDIGFLAVIKLVSFAPTGELSLRALCENVASGKSVDQSFTDVFGISKKDFYKLFAEYQKSYSAPTPTTISAGMAVINGKVILANSSQKYSDYVVSFCNSKIAQCLPGILISNDGSFITYLDPGDYKISVNPLNGGDTLGWYTEKGLLPDPSCAELLHVSDKEINITVEFHSTSCASASTPQAGMVGIHGKVIFADPNQKHKVFIVFCDQKVEQCSQGVQILENNSFFTYLTPGNYKISINAGDGGQAIGWYSENGLVSDGSCGSIFVVPENQEGSLTIDLRPTNICH